MEYKYCRRCSLPLSPASPEGFICPNSHAIYDAPGTGASVLLVDSQHNLYVGRRAAEPGKGTLDFIGGYINAGETAEEAAIREIEEEIGLVRSDYGPLQYLCSVANIYPFQGEDRQILSLLYWAKLLDDNVTMTPNDDVASIEKIPLAEIDLSQFHNPSAAIAIDRLRSTLT